MKNAFYTVNKSLNTFLNLMYRVINKKTNQECYLISCFIETSILA
jgi:hypothetical protein